MKKVRWVSATAGAAMVAATFALPGAGVAYASGNGGVAGNGNVSVLSGNSVSVPISAPVNLCGISLAVLGFSNSGCAGGASSSGLVSPSSGGGTGNGNVVGDGNVSVGSGNTISAPISAPVNVCGVSAAVGGSANSQCAGGASTQVTEPAPGGNGNVTGNGSVSVLSGNSVSAPVTAPVNLCGISLALLGLADSGCVGGASTNASGGTPANTGNMPGNSNGPLGGTVPAAPGATVPAAPDGTVPAAPGGTVLDGPRNNGQAAPGGTGPAAPRYNGPAAPGGAGPDAPRYNGPAAPGGTVLDAPADAPGDAAPGDAVPAAPRYNGPAAPGRVTAATMPSSGLPTTGADLLLLGVAAIGSIGVGAGMVALGRRRRNGEAP